MKPKLQIIPLGGMGTVTKNMYLYEYNDQILIVDCGIGFPDPTMLGVDVLIPDITYLLDKLDRIQGLVLTHAHDDHIGGLPYILPQIGTDFPIYGSRLTVGFAKDRLKEYGIKANFHEFGKKPVRLGDFMIDDIQMTHSVPDARHLAITLPLGTIYHGSDFKFDLEPIDGIRPDFQKIASIGQNGVIAALVDSLNSEVHEFSRSETSLISMFETQFHQATGKVIITVVSSNIHRIQQIINLAAAHNRKVAFVGRSIEQNVKTAANLGYLKLSKKIINRRKIKSFKDSELCIIIAGSQGQVGSSLSRAAEGDHPQVSIRPQDKVIFASEPIPGNEADVYATIDTLARLGADVTYSDIADNVHVSGHSSSIEQKLLVSLLNPREIIPIGGTYHHMIQFKKNMQSLDYPEAKIHLLDNGQILSLDSSKAWVSDQLDLKNVMVDGLGIGDVGHIVLRDRQRMADEGILVIIVPIEQQSGQVHGDIELITRGFVYVKESDDIIQEIKNEVINSLGADTRLVTNWHILRKKIETSVEKLVYEITERRPLILTLILEV